MRFINPAREPTDTTAIAVYEADDWGMIVLFDLERLTQAIDRGSVDATTVDGFIRISVDEDGIGHVSFSASYPGWGPLLYDLALSWAADHNLVGLIPSRTSVSPSASAIWLHYRTKRPDVESVPLATPNRAHIRPYLDRVYSLEHPVPSYRSLLELGEMGVSLEEQRTRFPIGEDLYEAGLEFFDKFYQTSRADRQAAAGMR